MENSNIIKQAKSDIFKELYTVIKFYISKGAKPQSLKRYYKNNKRFNDILEDIKNKGINLVEDENEYKKLVREILNEILDDFIAKQKDEEYKKNKSQKMKHIKEFYSFQMNEELSTFQHILLSAGAAFCLYKFVKGLFLDIIDRNAEKILSKMDKGELNSLARRVGQKLEVGEKIKFSEDLRYYIFELSDLTIKLDKINKLISWPDYKGKFKHDIPVTQEEIDQLITSLKEENNEKL